ncbi:MAG: hypothetical protein HFE85_04430 [Clostridiales bacterium]|nr:hypothetical protein [Clostridiales bacterium]
MKDMTKAALFAGGFMLLGAAAAWAVRTYQREKLQSELLEYVPEMLEDYSGDAATPAYLKPQKKTAEQSIEEAADDIAADPQPVEDCADPLEPGSEEDEESF